MTQPATILIIEDDPGILLGLQELLTGEGHAVHSTSNGSQAEPMLLQHQPDLILLDLMLPGQSGYDICRHLRRKGHRTPILILTAKSQEIDKVIGLELGADDYVTKPFGVRELLARINALLRRAALNALPPAPTAPEPAKPETQPFPLPGGLRADPATHRLHAPDPALPAQDLTARELHLLRLFHQRPGHVLTRDYLLETVWGLAYTGTTRTLDQTIVQLRRKLARAGAPSDLLSTVHGLGYRMEAPAQP